MTEDDGPSANRRRLLRTLAASAAVPAIAGCSGGGGDGEDGGDGSDGTDGTDAGDGTDSGDGSDGMDGTDSGDGGDSTPADTETTAPSTTEAGSGGDSAFVGKMKTQDNVDSEWDQFGSFTVDFERISLVSVEGEPIDMQVGTELDLVELEPGVTETYVEETAIPAGRYEVVELHMPIQSATLSDGSEPSDPLPDLDPWAVELGISDDYLEVESGTTFELTFTINLIEAYTRDGWTLAVGWFRGF